MVSAEQSGVLNGIVCFDSVANDVERVRLFHAEAGALRPTWKALSCVERA
jgi:hypothetical protein